MMKHLLLTRIGHKVINGSTQQRGQEWLELTIRTILVERDGGKRSLSPDLHRDGFLDLFLPHSPSQLALTMLERILPTSTYSLLSTLHLLNPVNASLSILLIYLVISLIPSTPTLPHYPLPTTPLQGYNYRPLHHPKSVKWEKFTPQELTKFDGKQPEVNGVGGGRILFAIRRKVYDVTLGASFYGPGQSITLTHTVPPLFSPHMDPDTIPRLPTKRWTL